MPIIDDRLAKLDKIELTYGSHTSPEHGMCIMEAVAWIVEGEKWSDAPECVSPVIRSFCIALNDRLGNEDRQRLKPYIIKVIGTRGDAALESQRSWMATNWLIRERLPIRLRAAGLDEQADILAGLGVLDPETTPPILPALRAIRDQSWDLRRTLLDGVRTKVRAAVTEKLPAEVAEAVAVVAAAAEAAAAAEVVVAEAVAVGKRGYVYDTVYYAVRDTLRSILRDKLAESRSESLASALDLLDRMICIEGAST